MLKEKTVEIAEIAAALGIAEDKLKRRYRSLHERQGFPLPLPAGNWRWSRRAVEEWIASGGARAETPIADQPTESVVLDQQRALRRRYGSRA